MESLKNLIQQSQDYQILEIGGSEESRYWHLLHINKVNGELIIQDQFSGSSFSEIESALKDSTALTLCLNTTEVLGKINASSENTKIRIETIFPQIQAEDFVVDLRNISETDQVYAALIRKEELQQWLSFFESLKIKLRYISIGMGPVISLKSKFDTKSVSLNGYRINQMEHSLSIEQTNDQNPGSFELSGYSIDSASILGFCTAIDSINPANDEDSSLFRFNLNLLDKEDERKTTQLVLYSGLILSLLILLINFFFYLNIQGKLQELETEYLNNQSAQVVKSLKLAISAKKERIETYNLEGKTNFTYFLEKVGNTRPNSILLSEISLDNQEVENDQGSILLQGLASNYNDLIGWKSTMDNLSLFNGSELLQYEQQKNGKFEFILQINFKP